MKKTFLAIICLELLFIGGCGIKEKNEVIEEPTKERNTTQEEQKTGEEKREVLTGTIPKEEDITSLIKNMDDISIQENGLGFFRENKTTKSTEGENIIVTIKSFSGKDFLEIQKGEELLERNKQEKSEFEKILTINDKITGVYGPYTNVFASGTYILYTSSFSNGGATKQNLLPLDTMKEEDTPYYFLYHDKENKKLFATNVNQDTNEISRFSGIIVFTNNQKTLLTNEGFDGHAYDGFYLYIYQVNWDTETAKIWILDTDKKQTTATIEDLAIGGEGARFFFAHDRLLVDFSVPSGIEKISRHVLSYNMVTKSIDREIEVY